MSKPISPRRLAENEVYFRQKNRAVEEQFDQTKKLALAHGQIDLIDDRDLELHFFCECSDENCRLRIPLKRSRYDRIHQANDQFVIICGHQVAEVEQVVEETDSYCVVQKKTEPPQISEELSSTSATNV